MKHLFDTRRFVDDVRTSVREGQRGVEEVLRRAVSDPHAIVTGLGGPMQAGIHTLHRSDEVTVLNVVWAPHMVLLPHDHNMWASIGIYSGREDNILWERRDGGLAANGAASLSESDVFSLAVEAIHSVINPIPRLTGAIHIYGGDYFAPGRSEWDAETLEERPFDLDRARVEFARAVKRFAVD
jgi:predicted metal-dependent enzyme (double-stranded beta helix superfamily)